MQCLCRSCSCSCYRCWCRKILCNFGIFNKFLHKLHPPFRSGFDRINAHGAAFFQFSSICQLPLNHQQGNCGITTEICFISLDCLDSQQYFTQEDALHPFRKYSLHFKHPSRAIAAAKRTSTISLIASIQ